MAAANPFPFQISDSIEISDQLYHITPEEQKVLEKAQTDAHSRKKGAHKRLEQYVQQYPHLPQLKNYLSVYYYRHGQFEKAAALNRETLQQHPGYLFARVGVATDLYQKGQWAEMLPLLGEKLELNALYPEREVFHVSEVMSYYGAVALYLNAAGKSSKAWELLKRLEAVDPGHHMLEKVESAIMSYNLEHAGERMAQWEATSRTVAGSLRPATETTSRPQFENSLVNTLYEYDMELPPEILQQILALPPDSLVADLKKVLGDSRARYHYLQDDATEDHTLFPVHALLILAELGRADALPEIFELLRNGDEFNDFYFGDMTTELLWVVFYKLGLPDVAPLILFLKEPIVSTYGKIPVTQALEQLYYHQPQLQASVVQGLHEVAQHFLDHRHDETLVDTLVIADIAGMLWKLGGERQKEVIKALYDENLVYVGAYGSYEELLEWKADPEEERQEVRDIFGIYAHVVSTWSGYQDDDENDEFLDDEEDFAEDADWEIVPQPQSALETAHTPFVRSEPKVGRNDPCPCGSGKKYKKCCGKE